VEKIAAPYVFYLFQKLFLTGDKLVLDARMPIKNKIIVAPAHFVEHQCLKMTQIPSNNSIGG
jgi:hypothetical protein